MASDDDYFFDRPDSPADEGFYAGGTFVGPETDKARLFKLDDLENGAEVWLPKSQILDEDPAGVTVTSWLADQRGWDDDDPDEGEIPF